MPPLIDWGVAAAVGAPVERHVGRVGFLGGQTSRRLDVLRVATLSGPLGVVPLTLLAFLRTI